MLDLTRASAQDITADPGATAAWEYARRHGPPRPGEVITQLRFTVDRQAHQASSPTFNAASILSMQHWSQTPKLAWYFVTLTAPDRWNDYFSFAHDLRQVPLDMWLDLATERALAELFTTEPPTPRPPALLVLSQVEFAAAIRQALRDLPRVDLLAHKPPHE